MLGLFPGSRNNQRARAMRKDTLGEVVSIVGEADQRAKAQMIFETLVAGSQLNDGELIVVHEASQVTLKFNGGSSVRLQPGARLVAEHDSSRAAGAVLATLLDGDADVLTNGTSGSFRLIKNGRDVTVGGSTGSTAPDAVVVSGTSRVFQSASGRRSGGDSVSIGIVTATTPIETPLPLPQTTPRMGDESVDQVSVDSLSNEEIRKALRSEGGFFSRCYLNYLSRVKPSAAALKSTTITVGFVILNSGKSRDAKVVRSDFNDVVLNNCVLETVERTPFRAFRAPDIPVLEFPIELK